MRLEFRSPDDNNPVPIFIERDHVVNVQPSRIEPDNVTEVYTTGREKPFLVQGNCADVLDKLSKSA